jgi:hypothetical protein
MSDSENPYPFNTSSMMNSVERRLPFILVETRNGNFFSLISAIERIPVSARTAKTRRSQEGNTPIARSVIFFL